MLLKIGAISFFVWAFGPLVSKKKEGAIDTLNLCKGQFFYGISDELNSFFFADTAVICIRF